MPGRPPVSLQEGRHDYDADHRVSYRLSELVWKNSRAEGITRLVLLAVADRANDKSAIAWPSIADLESRTKVHRATIIRHLAKLVKMGELEVVKQGGGRGTTHFRVVPAAAPQPALLPRTNGHHPSQPATGRQLRLVAGSDGSSSTSATSAVALVRQVTGKEPPSEPVIGTGAHSRAAVEKVPTVEEEERAQAKEAVAIWTEIRARKGLDRFTDRRALGGLRMKVKVALKQVEWRDVVAAIRQKAYDPKANPWYLDEWAREQRGIREQAESTARKMRERDREALEPTDPRVLAELQSLAVRMRTN